MLANYCWTGVMVELQSDAFERLKRNYAAQSQRLKFLNAAISDEPGERTLFYISEAEKEALGLPDWAREIPSFDPEHLSKHFPQAKLARHNVRTTTFEEAASLLPAGGDVVVIDTEGHERTIVDTMDLDLHHVKFVMFEHKHLSENDRMRSRQAAGAQVLAQEVRPGHRSVARSGASWRRDQVRARICLHWHSTALGQPAAQRCGR
jgi:FkbM family methyltransferase